MALLTRGVAPLFVCAATTALRPGAIQNYRGDGRACLRWRKGERFSRRVWRSRRFPGLTHSYSVLYNSDMKRTKRKLVALRIDPHRWHQARVAAVIAKKTMGEWLEEAIEAKAAGEGVRLHGKQD